MKTKKTVIAVLTATLLVSAMLIAGCIDQLDEITVKVKDKDNEVTIVGDSDVDVADVDVADNQIPYKIPVGKGVVRFKITDNNIRTILPDFSQYDDLSGNKIANMHFDIEFTRHVSGGGTGDGDIIYFPGDGTVDPGDFSTKPSSKATYSQVTSPITILNNGYYGYKITAYDDNNGTVTIAGFTSTTDISVSSGTIGSASVTLIPFMDGSFNGNFYYGVTIPVDTYNTKTLSIYAYNNLTTPIVNGVITLNEDGTKKTATISIPSGYYIVKVTIGKNHYLTRQHTEALHVYPGFTSKMTDLVIDTPLVQSEFELSFNMNGKTNTNNTDNFNPRYVNYGAKANDPGTPIANGYGFDGWFENQAGSGSAWDFATRLILSTRTLWAKWHQTAGFAITMEEPEEQAGTPEFTSDTSLDRDGLTGIGYIELTFNAPEDGTSSWDTNSVVWSINPSVDALADLPNYHSNSLRIYNGGNFSTLLSPGNLSFTVSVTAKINNKPYSANIIVPVIGVSPSP